MTEDTRYRVSGQMQSKPTHAQMQKTRGLDRVLPQILYIYQYMGAILDKLYSILLLVYLV